VSVVVDERRSLLAERDFRLYFLSRSASIAGTAASAVALPLLTYQTSGSAALTAAVAGLEALPYLLFGLFAGAAADRLRRRTMMVSADIACALLLATLPVAQAFGTPAGWHVLAVAFGLGCGFCWFDAAAWGARTRLVGRARLADANSLIVTSEIVFEIAVPAAAGLLAAATDPTVVLAADAASYLASAALIARLRTNLDPTARPASRRLLAEIGEGLRYLWRQPVVRTMTLAGFGLNLSVGGAFGLLVVYADEVLGMTTPDRRIGLLYTAAAVGSLLAARLLPAFSRRVGQGPVSVIVYATYVLALVALVVNPLFIGALLCWAAWDFARTTANINGITVRQQVTPDELQGRVNTTGRMIAWGGTPFGALLGGLVAQAGGVTAAYLVLAIPAAAGCLVLLASPVRRLRTAMP
jgi:MFS family permease